jgi:heme exporter protein CcmD
MSHGFYIWGSYAVTFAALALEVIFLFRRARRCERVEPSRADKMTP